MSQQKTESGPLGRVFDDFVKWLVDRLERTPIVTFRFQIPRMAVSPFGYLGTLTGIVFALLGITGALLMLYYRPDVNLAYNSVKEIEEKIAFGFFIRNIHYHASNAMVFLAIAHLFYQYFSGRYKVKNEVIWVTGVILGTVTVLEAFTGYDLILNQRAMLAVNIAVGLTNAAPILGPQLAPILLGGGLYDLIIRFYALHVFILPMVMLLLALVHFPRNLVFDPPVVAGVIGSILIAGGLFPVELGLKYDPTRAIVEVPEWYLTAIYAFIRTGLERFTSGALLPLLFIMFFLLVPFVDRSKKLSWKERPFFTAAGISSIVLIVVTTVWGFYTVPRVDAFTAVYIEPLVFYPLLVFLVAASFVISYKYIAPPPSARQPKPPVRTRPITFQLPYEWSVRIIMGLLAVNALLALVAFQNYLEGLKNLSLFNLGVIVMIFGLIAHIYRHAMQTVEKRPATAVPQTT
ncbi:MAG: cytochrome b N-terminal domain-containing protein [Candidatus Caldarchaeum sp.]|nr:cytochrome b N-terminal domain-containing protein [Candidatus Caldarchaeum sp.]MDW8063928.1 cytochrome b N-terminal domain-containing protein [Candidatus Caldarchaeum sp.]